MGVLLPNYAEENVVKGENVPNFKFGTSAGTSTGTSSNVFQILQDLYKAICSLQSLTWTTHIIEDTTLLEALHVQLVTLLYLYIF